MCETALIVGHARFGPGWQPKSLTDSSNRQTQELRRLLVKAIIRRKLVPFLHIAGRPVLLKREDAERDDFLLDFDSDKVRIFRNPDMSYPCWYDRQEIEAYVLKFTPRHLTKSNGKREKASGRERDAINLLIPMLKAGNRHTQGKADFFNSNPILLKFSGRPKQRIWSAVKESKRLDYFLPGAKITGK